MIRIWDEVRMSSFVSALTCQQCRTRYDLVCNLFLRNLARWYYGMKIREMILWNYERDITEIKADRNQTQNFSVSNSLVLIVRLDPMLCLLHISVYLISQFFLLFFLFVFLNNRGIFENQFLCLGFSTGHLLLSYHRYHRYYYGCYEDIQVKSSLFNKSYSSLSFIGRFLAKWYYGMKIREMIL